MSGYLRDCFLESTGIDLKEMRLMTKIEAEYFINPWAVRQMTIFTLPQIKENMGKFEDELYRIAYSIAHNEVGNYKIFTESNYALLTLTIDSNEELSNYKTQYIYEFVKK